MIRHTLYFVITVLSICSCTSNGSSKEESQKGETKHSINQEKEDMHISNLYVGTYTRKEGHVDGKANGIYVLNFDNRDGSLTMKDTILGSINPSYIALHPNRRFLYAANEVGIPNSEESGFIKVYENIDDNWKEIQSVHAGGKWPCHLTVDVDEQYLYVANYSGTMSKYLISKSGKLESTETILLSGKDSDHPRQDGPHAHMCMSIGKYVFIPDLGSNETMIFTNQEDENHKAGALVPSLHAGPRHMSVNKANSLVYVLNELSNTIDVFNISKIDGEVKPIQTISSIDYKAELGSQAASAIKLHKNGKWLYTASRGIQGSDKNTIELFQVNNVDGKLAYVSSVDSKGSVPRDFTIDPTGKYLLAANQNSDNIFVYKINQATGMLEETKVNFDIPTPVCLIF